MSENINKTGIVGAAINTKQLNTPKRIETGRYTFLDIFPVEVGDKITSNPDTYNWKGVMPNIGNTTPIDYTYLQSASGTPYPTGQMQDVAIAMMGKDGPVTVLIKNTSNPVGLMGQIYQSTSTANDNNGNPCQWSYQGYLVTWDGSNWVQGDVITMINGCEVNGNANPLNAGINSSSALWMSNASALQPIAPGTIHPITLMKTDTSPYPTYLFSVSNMTDTSCHPEE